MARRAREKWLISDDEQLAKLYETGNSVEFIAEKLERTKGAIRSRLKRKGLLIVSSADQSSGFANSNKTERRKKKVPKRRVKKQILSTIEKQQNKEKILKSKRTDESILEAFQYVYFIVNAELKVYIGCTRDVGHRIYQHNNNKGASVTKGKGPWYPFFIVCTLNEEEAFEIESRSKQEFHCVMEICEKSLNEVIDNIDINCRTRKLILLRA